MIDLNEVVSKEDAISKSFKLGEKSYTLKPMTKNRMDEFLRVSNEYQKQLDLKDVGSPHEFIGQQLQILLGMDPAEVYGMSLAAAKGILELVLKEAKLSGEPKDATSNVSAS